MGDLGAGGFGFLGHGFSPARGWVGVRGFPRYRRTTKAYHRGFRDGYPAMRPLAAGVDARQFRGKT